MNEFDEWLARISDGASLRSIATDLGIQNTALSRWIRNEKVPAEKVIDIARHYKASIYDGLHAAGYLDSDDLVAGTVDASIRLAQSRALLEELLRRVIAGEDLQSTPEQAIEAIVHRVIDQAKANGSP